MTGLGCAIVSLSSGAGQQSDLSQPTVWWLAPIWWTFWEFMFLQSFSWDSMATRCFLSHGNSVEINLFVLFMWLNTFLVLHVLCFCFAMKHCVTYRHGYLTGRCLLCTDVKKLTLIYTSGTNSHCIFTHTFLWHKFIWTASRVTYLRYFFELMALSTAHAIFASKMHTSGLFSACVNKAAC